MQERIQKILSVRGIASRRKAEEYIEQGLVRVNGTVATLGQKADPEVDTIEVSGKVIADRKEMLYFVMNKPEGVETTNVEGRKVIRAEKAERPEAKNFSALSAISHFSAFESVRDLLPSHLQGKVYPVGRLDKDSSGLLLFTNDGVLAYRLTHPKFDHDKEYEVVLDRPISPMICRKIEEGFEMDGFMTKPLEVKKIAPSKIRIVLHEGKNRQIRRMCQQFGFTVKYLKRIRILTLKDESLRKGSIRALTVTEKQALLGSVGLQKTGEM